MTVIVNGETAEFEEDTTVAKVLETRLGPGRPTSGVAVAVNGVVVARGQWAAWRLRPHDRVEVLAARGGG